MPFLTQDRVAAALETATRGEGLVAEAMAYHLATGGRAWRARLSLDCGRALDITDADAVSLAAACELVHQASIVHDDVQDEAMLRRGVPSVVARYGGPAAICVGDTLLVRAFAMLAPLPHGPELVRMFADRVTQIVAGQGEEFSPDLWHMMNRDRYQSLISAKAGAMVALPVEGAVVLAGLPPTNVNAACRVARLLGMAYQAADDICDLETDIMRGALNGILAWALESDEPWRSAELHAVLVRAQSKGLSLHEASELAAGLQQDATHLMAWARARLSEAKGLLGESKFDRVLALAADALDASLDSVAKGQSHAA